MATDPNANANANANTSAPVDYSVLDVTSAKDQEVLHKNVGNYDIDHMNWKQIEYDALYEGNIISTYEIITKWKHHFENNNKNKTNNDGTNEKEKEKEKDYLQEKEKYSQLINDISEHFESLKFGYNQLFPHKNVLNNNDDKNDNDDNNNNSNSNNNNKESKKEEEWITQVDNYNGISVFYRKEKDNPIHSIKIALKCKASPLEFLATINEFDLIPEVVTIIPLECRFIKTYTDVEKVIYAKANMWWPLKDRDAIVGVFAFDCLDYNHSIVIKGKSIDIENIKNNNNNDTNDKNTKNDEKNETNSNNSNNNNETKESKDNKENENGDVSNSKKKNSILKNENDPELATLAPAVAEKTVRMEITFAFGEIKVLKYNAENHNNNEIEISGMFNIDFKTFLPPWLINWVTRTFSYYACLMVRNKCENIYQSKKHVERINSQIIYSRIKDRLINWDLSNSKIATQKANNQNNDKTNDKTNDESTDKM